jgi:hypothetical protein
MSKERRYVEEDVAMKPKWIVDSYLALRLAQLLLAQKRKAKKP